MTSVSMLPTAALAALEQAANAALALDPDSQARLRPLAGRVVAVTLSGIGATLYLTAGADRLRLMGHYDGDIDTHLRGTPFALLGLAFARAGEGLFRGEVTMEGDVELGQRVQALLKELDIDWEEHLSRLVGDIAAHQIGNLFRGLVQGGSRLADSLRADVREYLQEERGDLPARDEVAVFMDAVDLLRSDTDRLEARVKRLLALGGEA